MRHAQLLAEHGSSRTSLAFSSGEYRRAVGRPDAPSIPMAPSSFPRSGASKQPGALHVPLPRGLLLEITRHLDGEVVATMDALVIFTGRTGEPVRYTGVRRSFDAACRRLGLVGVTPHSLRASCASWVAESDGVLEGGKAARAQSLERHDAALRSVHDGWRCSGSGTSGRGPYGRERGRH